MRSDERLALLLELRAEDMEEHRRKIGCSGFQTADTVLMREAAERIRELSGGGGDEGPEDITEELRTVLINRGEQARPEGDGLRMVSGKDPFVKGVYLVRAFDWAGEEHHKPDYPVWKVLKFKDQGWEKMPWIQNQEVVAWLGPLAGCEIGPMPKYPEVSEEVAQ